MGIKRNTAGQRRSKFLNPGGKPSSRIGKALDTGKVGRGKQMSAKQKIALKKAQQASAKKRRGKRIDR